MTATELEPTTTYFLNEHSTIQPNWPNDCGHVTWQEHAVKWTVQISTHNTAQLNHLASLTKWLSVCLRTKWLWVRVQLQSLKLQISHLLRARSSLTFRQLKSVDSIWNVYVTWQEYTVTGSGVMTIYFYKGLTKNPETGNITTPTPPPQIRVKAK